MHSKHHFKTSKNKKNHGIKRESDAEVEAFFKKHGRPMRIKQEESTKGEEGMGP